MYMYVCVCACKREKERERKWCILYLCVLDHTYMCNATFDNKIKIIMTLVH